MNQRGIGEVYLIAGVVVISMGAAIAVQTYRLESVKAEDAEFKGGVEALGKAPEQAAKVKEAKDKLAKEKADADKKRLTTDLAATVKRLRDARASRSFVPSAPAASTRPDFACFDRKALESAIGGFIEEARTIADRGSEATINLDTAKKWAQHGND